MQTLDSRFCGASNAAGQAGATQGFNGFQGSPQDRADRLVRDTVLADLGQSVGHGRHGHGIQAVAAAVAKVLSGQDVTGTDAADDVLKKIETSLHEAAQKLADRGVDAKTIDATIDKFRDQLAKALEGAIGSTGSGSSSGSSSGSGSTAGSGASGAGGTAGSTGTTSGSSDATGSTDAPTNTQAPTTTSVSTFVAREVRKERGAIDLVTAEGDRVSIRFRTKEVVTASGAQATSSDGSTVTAAKGSVFSRGGVKIEVDGDLNENELAAIGDLLGKVDDIATKFFSGDVQAAFSAAGSLGVDSDQIAAYRLNLTYSRKVASAYQYAGASLPPSTQTPATGDGIGASSANGSGSTSASNGSSSGSASTSSSSATSSPGASDSASSSNGTSSTSDAGANDAAAGNGTSSASTGDATSGASDGLPTSGTADAQPATPASAQKTILNFINDALSKLSTSNGAGRLSFSTQWKMSVVVTAIQSLQPEQPTTAADKAAANNTQLLGDSLQKIAAA